MSKKFINLIEYPKNLGGLSSLQKNLIENLHSKIFHLSSRREIIVEALKLIRPASKKSYKNDLQILEAISNVLGHFSLDEIKEISGDEKEIEQDYLELFFNWVLGLSSIPSAHFQELKSNVESDLKKMHELLVQYESDTTITSFLKVGTYIKNQKNKTIVTFYKRCLSENRKITQYYLFDIKERALQKSRFFPIDVGLLTAMSFFKDYPYSFNQRWGISFDHNHIDKSGHRLDSIILKHLSELRKLYTTNKSGFYKKYFKLRSKKEIFQNINYFRSILPFRKNRNEIFEELEYLFMKKRWTSFFALALPQVEGLFTEMTNILFPKKSSMRSLPEKVNIIRDRYDHSLLSFDYFEYILPNIRNAFSHTGHIDYFELYSFDLLTDLEYVLNVYSQIKSPFVSLTKKIKMGSRFAFTSFKEYLIHFKEIEKLDESHQSEIKDSLDKFNQRIIFEEGVYIFLNQDALDLFLQLKKDLILNLEYQISTYNIFSKIEVQNIGWIKEKLKNKDFRQEFKNFAELNNYNLEEIIHLFEYFKLARKFLKKYNLFAKYKFQFDEYDRDRKFIKNLKYLYSNISSEKFDE